MPLPTFAPSILNNGYAYRDSIGVAGQGQTVLTYLTKRYRHSDAETWTARLAAGEVTLNGQTAHGAERLRQGQTLIWQRPPWQEEPAPLHFDVLYGDESLLAVSKPSGLPTLPGGGFLEHTLLMQVRKQFPEATPLHRLGRGTSGLVLCSRTRAAASGVLRGWRDHEVQKTYRALASGHSEQDSYRISTPIGPVPHPLLGSVYAASPEGKPSLSVARVLERRADSTLFEIDIYTGRPHQIRIHLASVGMPLVGDPLYGPDGLPLSHLPGLPGDLGYWLHSARLAFAHPVGRVWLELSAPVPKMLAVHGEGV
ncbi:RluA family pseudouridine synthase [Deinococcus sp. QL22]|uniref:RluA family pseudouridine synthase n=1 Tax=Deinococcus sp. QL22 TaxID=2939437 RepID=UPI002017BCC5|nr:RluA family pseudouridine synthase [Deinococcus sp. QL22]UQN07667.1 RluA family pseudouridine synthase [Deinococcus sp. QL22]